MRMQISSLFEASETCNLMFILGMFRKKICFKLQMKLLCLRIKARRIPDETTVLTLFVDFW